MKAYTATDPFEEALTREAREWQPLLAAAFARLAVERYREWAATPGGERYRSRLVACADRQEEIVRDVEALYRDAVRIEREIVARNADLAEADRRAFADRTLIEQLLIQARRARRGAAVWQAVAQQERDAGRRHAFLRCAELEETNALVIEATISSVPT